MRRCNKCFKEKDEKEFHWKIKNVRRKTTCSSCEKEYHKSHYLNNENYRNKCKESAKVKNKEYNERNLSILGDILQTNCCADCGETNPIVLEFDHIKGKSIGIARLKRNAASIKTLLSEVSKCEIVCANCHRKRTYSRLDKTWRDNLLTKIF